MQLILDSRLFSHQMGTIMRLFLATATRVVSSKRRLALALFSALAVGTAPPAGAQSRAPFSGAAVGAWDAADADVTTLPEVEVQGERLSAVYAGGQVATGSRVGMLGNRDVMDTPFSTVSYTEAFIEAIQARELTDVLAATDPTVFNSGMRGEFRESYSIRGFVSNSTDVQFNGLHGMAPIYRSSVELVERVEILRGPSAALGGMPPGGSVGGSINLVPKRAGEVPLARLTTRYMSAAQWGAHADVGRRFGERGQFGVRLNGAYRDGEVAIKEQEKQMHLGAVALDWRGERVRIAVDGYLAKDRIKGHSRGVSLDAGLTAVPKPPRADTPIAPTWSEVQSEDRAATLRADWELSERISAYAAAGRSQSDYRSTRSPFGGTIINEAGDTLTTFGDLGFDYTKTSAQAGLNGAFSTGSLTHRWGANASVYRHTDDEYGFRHMQTVSSNLYAPDWSTQIDYAPGLMPLFRAKTQLGSYGLADTIGVAQDRLQVTVGLRRQQVKTERFSLTTGARTAHYDESATSPTAAALAKVSERLSFYANLSQGLSEGATAPLGTANEGEIFAPFKTRQKELGLKIDFGRFSHTLSVFEIKRPNSYTDVVTNVFSSGGQQRNRGVEWSFAGVTPLPNVRLMGGAAWLDAKVTRAATPELQGKRATGAPKTQAKLGVEWDVPLVENLTLTANANYAAKQYISADNRLPIAARTVYDVGASYSTQLGDRPLTLRASVTNVANKAYWGIPTLGGTLGLGEPRTVLLSASIGF